jgi:hypothetical protein
MANRAQDAQVVELTASKLTREPYQLESDRKSARAFGTPDLACATRTHALDF